MIILVTGGQRSGKSAYAEQRALSLSDSPVYIATAHVGDDEFARRVEAHRRRRGDKWTTIEEERFLSRHHIYNKVVLIDCVTLWCSNFLFNAEDGSMLSVDEALQAVKREFDLFTSRQGIFIFVTNEIGWGGVSPDAVQRRFTDLQGSVNQYIASKADEVVLVVSGIAMKLKDG